MDYKKTILILSLIILFVGCRKDLMIDPNNISYTSDVEQFERVWDGLNTNYEYEKEEWIVRPHTGI